MTRSIYSLWPWTTTGGCTATMEPDVVTGLVATASGSTTINLVWDADTTAAPNEATGYAVLRSTTGTGSWIQIATVNAPTLSYSDTSLSAGQTRYYQIVATNCADSANPSSTANATTAAGSCGALAVPDAPFDLASSGVTSTSITLEWDDTTASQDEADDYEIGISSDGGTTWTTITKSAPALSHTFTGLSASTTYDFRIRGVNCFGTGNYDGEAFSETTAAASLSPSWSLDFSSGTPSGYTLTRASSGTYVDSSGYIASASTDVARLTHNSSGSRLGLLVEESRTNLALQSENSNSNMGSTANVTNTANDAISPDNTTTADRQEITSTGYSYKGGVYSRPAGTYVASLYIKQKSASQSVGFRLVDGNGVGTATTITTTADWQRIQVAHTTTATGSLQFGLDQRTAVGGPGTSADVLVWGYQLEEGSAPTSYIPTTTATVTRSADLAHVLDSSITSWGDPGALVIHFYPPGKAGTLLSTDDASTAQVGIEASSTTAARAFWSSGSTSTGTIGSSGVQKAVHYWNGGTSKFCINGGTVQSGTNNLTIANTDFVTLGAEATDSSNVPGTFSQYANCVIRKVEFYSGTLTDANLQTVTT